MTLEKLIAFLADYKDISADTITAASTFESLDLDSLDTVELLMRLEDETGVSIELDEKLRTVGDLLGALEAGA